MNDSLSALARHGKVKEEDLPKIAEKNPKQVARLIAAHGYSEKPFEIKDENLAKLALHKDHDLSHKAIDRIQNKDLLHDTLNKKIEVLNNTPENKIDIRDDSPIGWGIQKLNDGDKARSLINKIKYDPIRFNVMSSSKHSSPEMISQVLDSGVRVSPNLPNIDDSIVHKIIHHPVLSNASKAALIEGITNHKAVYGGYNKITDQGMNHIHSVVNQGKLFNYNSRRMLGALISHSHIDPDLAHESLEKGIIDRADLQRLIRDHENIHKKTMLEAVKRYPNDGIVHVIARHPNVSHKDFHSIIDASNSFDDVDKNLFKKQFNEVFFEKK